MPNLDDMLTPEEMATWFKISERELAEKSRGNKPKIPVFSSLGQKSRRYHPRTVIAKFAKDAGVSMELIAASFGIDMKGQQ